MIKLTNYHKYKDELKTYVNVNSICGIEEESDGCSIYTTGGMFRVSESINVVYDKVFKY